jgi:hypothetical protein
MFPWHLMCVHCAGTQYAQRTDASCQPVFAALLRSVAVLGPCVLEAYATSTKDALQLLGRPGALLWPVLLFGH